MRFCRYCGAKLSEDAKYCNVCGKAVGSDPQDTARSEGAPNTPKEEEGGAKPYGQVNGGQGNGAMPPDNGQCGGAPDARRGGYGGYYGMPNGGQPYYAPPFAAQAQPGYGGEKPKNNCGIVGFILSMISVLCFIILVVLCVSYLAANPEMIDSEYAVYSGGFVMFGGMVLLLLVCMFLFSLAGLIVSAIGVAQRVRFRLNGFAIAGLVIGALNVFLILVMFMSAM